MCIGETVDSLNPAEQLLLLQQASERLPDYRPAIRRNDDLIWAVLEPLQANAQPRLTICRIETSIVVMIEDASRQRHFASMAKMEDVVVFACRLTSRSVLAPRLVHQAPQLAQ